MADAALYLGAGLLAGAGKGVADLFVEEARTKKEERLERLRQQHRREEAVETRRHQTELADRNDANAAKREAERDARLATREAEKDARAASDPLRQAQTDYYRSQADYNRAGRPRGGATMLKVGADSGRIYATDHEGPGENDEAVVVVNSTDALRLKSVQANNETRREIARLGGESRERVATTRADASRDTARTRADASRDTAQTRADASRDVASTTGESRERAAQTTALSRESAAVTTAESRERAAERSAQARERASETSAQSRRDVAQTNATARTSARAYAPDQITKLRTARDALPDDHPDREIYNEALKGIAQGGGTLSDAKIAEIKQRTLKDVQTATDARGKSLYATPDAQQAEYERRLKLVLPEPTAPAPRRPAAAAPAAAQPAPESTPEAARPAAEPAAAPTGGITLKGAGTREDPYIATTQAEIDHFKKTAPTGAVIVINGKKYTK